jgi:hypothetical protein
VSKTPPELRQFFRSALDGGVPKHRPNCISSSVQRRGTVFLQTKKLQRRKAFCTSRELFYEKSTPRCAGAEPQRPP